MAATLLFVPLTLLAVVLHAAALGAAAMRTGRLRPQPVAGAGQPLLHAFFAVALGLAIDTALLFGLGLAGLFTRAAVLSAGGLALLAALPALRDLPLAARQAMRAATPATLCGMLALAVLFGALNLTAMQPPGHWDDTAYHLPVARSYIAHHGIVLEEFLRLPLFPQNGNLLIALGLLLGGDAVAQAIATLPVFVLVLGLLGASAWLAGSLLPGVVASAMLLTLQPLVTTLGYAYIDNALALFCWAALLAVAMWRASDRPATGWLVLAGVMAGSAMGTKYFGAVTAVLCGAYLLLCQRQWRATLVFGAVAAVFGLGWYLRAFLISGDPVHPLGGNLFGHFLWNADDLAFLRLEQATYGADKSPLRLFAVLRKVGALVWLPALATLFFVHRQSPPLRWLQLGCWGYFAFWFATSHVDRYLAPIYGVACFLSAWGLCAALAFAARRLPAAQPSTRGWAARLGALAVLVAAVGWCGWRATIATDNLRHWAARQADRQGWVLLTEANRQAPQHGDRLLQAGFENGFYFYGGTMIGDWFGPARYRQMMATDCGLAFPCALAGPDTMAALMRRFDARLLAINTRLFTFDATAYAARFQTLKETPDGVLLAPRD